MPKLANLLVSAAFALTAVVPMPATPAAPAAGTRFSVLQMNLCLSGVARCYSQATHEAVVDEAADQVLQADAAAVTLNEVCSRDAERLARQTAYQVRFAPVLIGGAPFPCVEPGNRGMFGIAVLTKASIRTSQDRAFAAQADAEERRWLCATTVGAVSVCTAHLSAPGPAGAEEANDGECAELRGVLARYAEAGTTVFGGDVNRQRSCAPDAMWTLGDTAAGQAPGIQHVYGSRSLRQPSARVAAATFTDHDFLVTLGRLEPGPRCVTA